MRIKHIEIVSYNPNWPQDFQKEATLLKQYLKSHCLELHHIGSTSIPGLCAKPQIDIICQVDSLENSLTLTKHEYIFKHELNIPLRYYFSKNTPFSKVNLHVVENGHEFIHLNLSFRDYLRSHPEEIEKYAQLKENLLKDPKSFEVQEHRFSGYNLAKDTFIKSILKKAGYEGCHVAFCLHDQEWSHYHRIRKEQIFAPLGIEYNPSHPTITQKHHFHFVLYHGTQIVSCAHVEWLGSQEAALRTLATDEKEKKNGYGTLLLEFIEKWLRHHKKIVVKLHGAIDQVAFYKKRGYVEMNFDDVGICHQKDSLDLGKNL